MKKPPILLLILSTMLLGACSVIEGANQSVQYVEQTQAYMNSLAEFAEQAPQMMKEAATNPETFQKLEDRVIKVKEDILQFNAANAPAIAKDLHQQLTDKNKLLLDEVNQALENGHLALDKLQNSEIVNTIQDVTGLVNRIENLGL
jgi:predicted sulfurtransferase